MKQGKLFTRKMGRLAYREVADISRLKNSDILLAWLMLPNLNLCRTPKAAKSNERPGPETSSQTRL